MCDRTCRMCFETKPISQFREAVNERTYCNNCYNKYHLTRTRFNSTCKRFRICCSICAEFLRYSRYTYKFGCNDNKICKHCALRGKLVYCLYCEYIFSNDAKFYNRTRMCCKYCLENIKKASDSGKEYSRD
jgi:hypothetical protein